MDEELLWAAQTVEPGVWLKTKGQERRSCPGRDQKGLPRVILRGEERAITTVRLFRNVYASKGLESQVMHWRSIALSHELIRGFIEFHVGILM